MSLRVLAFTLTSILLMGPVFAQSAAIWRDGQPAIQSPDETRRSTARQLRSQRRKHPELMSGGRRPNITPQAPKIISVPNNEPMGTVIIVTKARKLYYTLSRSRAYEYSISVGRQGFAWTGIEKISRIADWPDWHPPAEMRQREPGLPKKMTGGLRNPLGAAALYLGDTLYRIHGTNNAKSIGRGSSSGCFRMMNRHIAHLARLVNVGTTVKVVNNWRLGGATVSGVVDEDRGNSGNVNQAISDAGSPDASADAAPSSQTAPLDWPRSRQPGRWYRMNGRRCKIIEDGRLVCRKRWRPIRDAILRRRRIRRLRRRN